MTLPVALTTEIQKLAPSAIIELFVLDATSLGGDILRFHAGTNSLTQNIVWQGNTYVRFPIRVSGFEITGQGQFPRPKLQVANVLSAISPLILAYNDLLGAKLTRQRTMAKFLDAVNFSGGINPTADSTTEFQEDVYFIDRKSSEDRDAVEFELAASVDLIGVSLPRRQVIQNVCVWKYRGAECGFTGLPLIDQNDQKITTATTVQGQTLINAVIARDAAAAALSAAETILTADAQAMGAACEYLNLGAFIGCTDLGSGFTDGVAIDQYGNVTAKRGGTIVAIGAGYRRGDFFARIGTTHVYMIEAWGPGAGCAAATSAYDAALTDRDTNKTVFDSAQAAMDAAITALPSNDPIRKQDICGKRLSSCKVRFGENSELPFGSFPAAGLAK